MTRGLIVTGGHVNHDLLLMLFKDNVYDLVMAVDGGMSSLYVINHKPDYIIGDFDSCTERVLTHFRKLAVKELIFESEKDMTDTELAIEKMIELEMGEITLVGATGTRIDHVYANLMMLEKFSGRVEMKIMDDHNCISIGHSPMVIAKSDYQYLSLLPITEEVSGLTITGVKYPLLDVTISKYSSFTVSNEIVDDHAILDYRDGKLLVVESKD